MSNMSKKRRFPLFPIGSKLAYKQQGNQAKKREATWCTKWRTSRYRPAGRCSCRAPRTCPTTPTRARRRSTGWTTSCRAAGPTSLTTKAASSTSTSATRPTRSRTTSPCYGRRSRWPHRRPRIRCPSHPTTATTTNPQCTRWTTTTARADATARTVRRARPAPA